MSRPRTQPRIGIDLGGTKIEGLLLGQDGSEMRRLRVATPRSYEASLDAIAGLVRRLDEEAGGPVSVGIGMPGSLSPTTGLVQNSNSTWLNRRPLDRDLAALLARPLRFANDANCFALSEAADGAGAGAASVFGVILGTGCGGGLVVAGRLINGPRSIGGEWGHNPLPWSLPEEHPGPLCWCGRRGCMEVWASGSGLEADFNRSTGVQLAAEAIVTRREAGDADAAAALERHASRLARGIAHVVNIFDPEVVVLGGGLSRLTHLYAVLPGLIAPHIFADPPIPPDVRPPRWGDASGARGAARLWEEQEV